MLFFFLKNLDFSKHQFRKQLLMKEGDWALSQLIVFLFKSQQMTSGGTESILMACKAYRDRALAEGVKKPIM